MAEIREKILDAICRWSLSRDALPFELADEIMELVEEYAAEEAERDWAPTKPATPL